VDPGRGQSPDGVAANGQSLVAGPLYVSVRGLEIEFDFCDHTPRATRRYHRRLALEPRSVFDFYTEVMATLNEFGVEVLVLKGAKFEHATRYCLIASVDPVGAQVFVVDVFGGAFRLPPLARLRLAACGFARMAEIRWIVDQRASRWPFSILEMSA
jgi:hypothetical protein